MKQLAKALSAVLALFIATCCAATTQQPQAGGSCTYDKYSGKATITKIEKTDASTKQARINTSAGYEGFEIWYMFSPDKPLPSGRWNEMIRKPKLFQLNSSMYPGEKYIGKYGIKVENIYPTTLSIIKTGTCTPYLYDLQGLNPNDDFESRGEKR